jgi:hypothetical protein
MGESLREILQALTRYSANDPPFPVNDRSLLRIVICWRGRRPGALVNPLRRAVLLRASPGRH